MAFSIIYFPLLFVGIGSALVATDTGNRAIGLFATSAGALAMLAILAIGTSPFLPCILALVTLLGSAYYALLKPDLTVAVPVVLVMCALALGLHWVPGLPQFPVYDHTVISVRYPHPLLIVGNFDKGIAGLAVLIVAMRWPRRISNRIGAGLHAWWRVPVVVVAMVAIALATGALRWDPKWPVHIDRFILSNVFLTCAAEEALFRGAIFGYVRSLLPTNSTGSWLAIIGTSVPFALVHTGDFSYLLLVLGVGIGCGWIRERTGHIGAAFTAHASINIVHIILLSYPSP